MVNRVLDSSMLAKYETTEFRHWGIDAVREGLLLGEKQLVDKYVATKTGPILDMGCGGGRISLALAELGYEQIVGIDFSEKMVERAKSNAQAKGVSRVVSFQAGDIRNVGLRASSFRYVLYFGNIICSLPGYEDRRKALREGHRILDREGLFIISALNYKSRRLNTAVAALLTVCRLLYNPNGYSKQMMPWLRKGGKPNWNFLSIREPQVYWYYKDEFVQELEDSGFKVLDSYNGGRQNQGDEHFASSREKGPLIYVCRKT